MKIFLFTLAVITSVAAVQTDITVTFTLRNNSMESIPLKIPGVMNPNLSPMSNSGVALETGQKIYFMEGRKKYLLLEVTEDLEGQVLIVNKLIRQRKKELGI